MTPSPKDAIGRTARAEAEGDAYIPVSPQEEGSLAQIERQISQRLPRVTLPDFDYRQPMDQRSHGHRHSGGQKQRTRDDKRSAKHGGHRQVVRRR
jgi:ATP-dependent RNA helicase RhlE